MKNKKNIAIIPARGGSKRLPNKNIRLLNGIPLLSYSIEYAQENTHLIDEIIVTTDDEKIKEFALKKGVQVIDRPLELSKDTSTTVSALKHVLENLQESYEDVILLQPTNPLRPKELLEEAYSQFIKGTHSSLFTVSRNEQKFGKIIDNTFIPFNYEIGQRSQDLDPLYYENGLLYISKARLILENSIIGEDNFPFIVDHPYAKVDIDTLEDFNYAEHLLISKTHE